MKLPDGPRTPSLLQTIQIIAQPTKFLDKCAERYGDTFTLRVLGLNSPPIVFFSNPQAIQQLFAAPAKQFDFGKAAHVFQPLMGSNSIILQQGKAHQRQRQLLLPPFHGERLQIYGELICQITTAVINEWKLGSTVSIRQQMSDITLQIILQVVFGISPGSRYKKLKQLLSSLLEDVTTPLYSTLFFFPSLQQDLGAWSPWGQFLRRQQQIDDLIYAEIAQRQSEHLTARQDVLSLLMSAQDDSGQRMSATELRDQLVSLLLLGYETTAAVLTWAFYLIHSSPQVLEQLQSELASIGAPTPEKIAKLPYLNAVCAETLRIYPIGLICVPRMLKEPLFLEGYEFNQGTVLIPCIYLAHRREQVYLEAEKFKPERFLTHKFSPFEYLPFGGGSRGCIGMAFSMYEMKLVLATILSSLRLSLVNSKPTPPVRRGITIVPAGGVEMRVLAVN